MANEDELLFRERLSFLQGFVSDIECQLGVLEGLQKVRDETGDEILEAIFQTILPAIEGRLILCAAQLLDEKSGTNIRKLLSHYKVSKDKIHHQDNPLSNDRIDELISTEHLASDKIRMLRDKALAHLDRQFTQSPSRFLSQIELSFEKDMIDVINYAQKVLSELSLAVDNSARISIGKIFYASTIEYFQREGKLF